MEFYIFRFSFQLLSRSIKQVQRSDFAGFRHLWGGDYFNLQQLFNISSPSSSHQLTSFFFSFFSANVRPIVDMSYMSISKAKENKVMNEIKETFTFACRRGIVKRIVSHTWPLRWRQPRSPRVSIAMIINIVRQRKKKSCRGARLTFYGVLRWESTSLKSDRIVNLSLFRFRVP